MRCPGCGSRLFRRLSRKWYFCQDCVNEFWYVKGEWWRVRYDEDGCVYDTKKITQEEIKDGTGDS